MSRDLLTKAQQALADGDLIQASEKGWGAAAQAVKAVAQARGWRHDSHRALFETVARLARETGDPDISTLFATAQALHTNFYEHWLPQDLVESDLNGVASFVRKLEPLAP